MRTGMQKEVDRGYRQTKEVVLGRDKEINPYHSTLLQELGYQKPSS